MGPKKKGNKKNDDWEADLGETVDPIAQAMADAKAEEGATNGVEEEDQEAGGGGLLAALKKNRGKKAKKGKVVEDFVEGEDPPGADGLNGVNGTSADPPADLAAKAPQEADLDDEDEFALPQKKGGKGGKQQKGVKQGGKKDDEEDEGGEGAGLKSKKEKEKEKKEREKQRKKEQVSFDTLH